MPNRLEGTYAPGLVDTGILRANQIFLVLNHSRVKTCCWKNWRQEVRIAWNLMSHVGFVLVHYW
jgi:hypothetical protein